MLEYRIRIPIAASHRLTASATQTHREIRCKKLHNRIVGSFRFFRDARVAFHILSKDNSTLVRFFNELEIMMNPDALFMCKLVFVRKT